METKQQQGNQNEIGVVRNYDDVFMRSVIVSVSAFFSKLISFERYRNGALETVTVPVYYSMTGDQQFLTDKYLDPHQFPEDDSDKSSKVEGLYAKIPSGVFTITESGIQNANIAGGTERLVYFRDEENDFGAVYQVAYTARGNWLPEQFRAEVEIKTSSDIERMKVYDSIIEGLYKIRKCYINDYKGFKKIPLTLSFPENPQFTKNFTFKTNQEETLPILKLSVDIHTRRPVVDYTTSIRAENITSTFTKNLSIEDEKVHTEIWKR